MKSERRDRRINTRALPSHADAAMALEITRGEGRAESGEENEGGEIRHRREFSDGKRSEGFSDE